jgi:HD-GYP domain-containing protein (c-di-GMP phosphodiesterase class II)
MSSPAPARPRDPNVLERLIVQVAAAINTRALYAEGHPQVAQAAQAVLEATRAALARQEAVTFLIVGDDLVVDERPLRRAGIFHQNFVHALKRRNVERLTLARGLDLPELLQFVSVMAAGGIPPTTAHVVVGRVEMGAAEDETSPAAESRSPPVTAALIDEGREAFSRFRTDRRGSIHKMEEVVWSLMETLARSAHDVIPLAPLKTHDEYTFIHSVNVSLLVLAQGRTFGLQGPTLHSLGLASLCHDVGKLSVPLDVLNHPGKLEGDAWRIMQSHAEEGAWQLATMEEAPPLSVVVAYEHHLRYDGVPTYPVLDHPRKPTLAAQLTSLADVYDALSTLRPYQQARGRAAALAVLAQRAGTFHDPFLVGNFHRMAGVEPPPGA